MIARLVDMMDDFLFTFTDLSLADILTVAIMGVIEITTIIGVIWLILN
jgi:hypothetical protein